MARTRTQCVFLTHLKIFESTPPARNRLNGLADTSANEQFYRFACVCWNERVRACVCMSHIQRILDEFRKGWIVSVIIWMWATEFFRSTYACLWLHNANESSHSSKFKINCFLKRNYFSIWSPVVVDIVGQNKPQTRIPLPPFRMNFKTSLQLDLVFVSKICPHKSLSMVWLVLEEIPTVQTRGERKNVLLDIN